MDLLVIKNRIIIHFVEISDNKNISHNSLSNPIFNSDSSDSIYIYINIDLSYKYINYLF